MPFVGLLDRLSSRRSEPDVRSAGPSADADDLVFATKALPRFVSCLSSREFPVLLDLGPVVGTNVTYFGEQLGCKIFVEDVFADLEHHVRTGALDRLPAFFARRFPQESGSVDGILCWDFIDYLDRPAAQALAAELARLLRPGGALLGFFGTAQPRDARYTKFVVVDDGNLRHRSFPASRGRQSILLNRDIIKLFAGLRVSDSFLLQNNLREILFRQPA